VGTPPFPPFAPVEPILQEATEAAEGERFIVSPVYRVSTFLPERPTTYRSSALPDLRLPLAAAGGGATGFSDHGIVRLKRTGYFS